MPVSRKEQKKATRQKLIGAVKKVISEKNLDRVQVSDITKEAGVSHGTFYVHFENIDDIFKILITEFNEKMLQLISRAFENNNENQNMTLTEIAEIYLDQLEDSKPFIVAFVGRYGHSLPFDAVVEGFNPPLIDYISRMLTGFVKSESELPVDLSMLTYAVLSIWLRVGFRHILTENSHKESTVTILAGLTRATANEFLPEMAKENVFLRY